MMARTLGVLQLGNVSLNGTKIKANASKHEAMSWDYANKLEQPQPGPHPKDQVNFTDPESRIMPSSEGFVQGFNSQAAVDNGSHLIVAGHVADA